jgi:ABC-type transporter Mla MlaB component
LAEPSAARPVPPSPPHLEQRQGVVVIGGSIEPADVAALCERARPMLIAVAANDADRVVCEVGMLRADLAAVDALARLALTARRLDRSIVLRDEPPALRELLALAGLAGAVPCGPDSGLDPGR